MYYKRTDYTYICIYMYTSASLVPGVVPEGQYLIYYIKYRNMIYKYCNVYIYIYIYNI